MAYTFDQLGPLLYELRQHAQLQGNVGRKIRRFLAGIAPANKLDIELASSPNPELSRLLNELPLAYPNLYARAERLIARLERSHEFYPAEMHVAGMLPQVPAAPHSLILTVELGRLDVDTASMQDLRLLLEVAELTVEACLAFMTSFAAIDAERLGSFDLSPGDSQQHLAERVAIAARAGGLPVDMVSGMLPLSMTGILLAFGRTEVIEQIRAIIDEAIAA